MFQRSTEISPGDPIEHAAPRPASPGVVTGVTLQPNPWPLPAGFAAKDALASPLPGECGRWRMEEAKPEQAVKCLNGARKAGNARAEPQCSACGQTLGS